MSGREGTFLWGCASGVVFRESGCKRRKYIGPVLVMFHYSNDSLLL